MKICLSTIIDNGNPGAALQAYAAANFLSRFGEVEILDYCSTRKARVVSGDPRIFAFQRKLKRSPLTFYDDDVTAIRFAQLNYHAWFAGSDEVWKFDLTGENAYCPSSLPNVYWPVGTRGFTGSIAASVGSSTLQSVPPAIRPRLSAILDKMNVISVRDQRTERFVRKLSPTSDPRFLADPTFLLRPTGYIAGLNRFPKSILVMDLNDEINVLIRNLVSRGLEVAVLGQAPPGCGSISGGFGPLEWMNLPAHFGAVITARMHPTIMALLNGCPVLNLDRRAKSKELRERFGLRSSEQFDWNHLSENLDHERVKDLIADSRRDYSEWEQLLQEKLTEHFANLPKPETSAARPKG